MAASPIDMYRGYMPPETFNKRQQPDDFASTTYEIKNDMPIPFTRYNQRHHPFPPQEPPIYYPIHQPDASTYNLFTTLDKMAIRDYITIKDRAIYEFAVQLAQSYASRLRKRRNKPVQMYLRAEWHKQEQVGRIWRMG